MSDQPVVVKKIQPYPIETRLEIEGEAPLTVQIKKLTLQGFICDVGPAIVHVQGTYLTTFEVPASKSIIRGRSKVIKTYDQWVGPGSGAGSVASRLAELHFIQLSEEQREIIKRFLVRIKQI